VLDQPRLADARRPRDDRDRATARRAALECALEPADRVLAPDEDPGGLAGSVGGRGRRLGARSSTSAQKR
jgi:hypothetical protein